MSETRAKILQITADEWRLYALTDNGEIWQYGSDWSKLPPLPMDYDETEDEAA